MICRHIQVQFAASRRLYEATKRPALVRIQRGIPDMPHHRYLDAGVKRRDEGRQFDGVKAISTVFDYRQLQVQIRRGIAVSRKVLDRRHTPLSCNPRMNSVRTGATKAGKFPKARRLMIGLRR